MPRSSVTQPHMIEVTNLTKKYVGRTAVSGISFSVKSGEVVGLLGPNGAGKSTIIRILACYLSASSGSVRVGGHDVFHESEEVRKKIGYMPENNPLHLEMRVEEYLRFRARLKGVSRGAVRGRVADVVEQCALTDVNRKLIGQLSKGYRQRVGLADALVHEPELIILDEPTIGLDPNQIRSVRQLIKSLGGKHTVLLSTHILPEVEVTCSHVVILNQGKVLAADSPAALQGRLNEKERVVAEIAASREELVTCWEEMPAVAAFDIAPAEGEYYRCALMPSNGADLRPLIYLEARQRGWQLRELTRSRWSLEDVFVHVVRAEEEE